MNTPIVDFLKRYDSVRLHMPGHKGQPLIGCEPYDITEVQGADSLYEASGIIEASENNASALFGSKKTLYSAEGASLCIRAMLYLVTVHRPAGCANLILAARNVHKSFIYAAAAVGFDVAWLPTTDRTSVCSAAVSPEVLEATLRDMPMPPAAVYVTSPDYLGNIADIRGLSEVCKRYGTRLIADNAHGAYLKFLKPSRHPLDEGVFMCCDSAHKTLPALTGAAYLHFSADVPDEIVADGKNALALFGTTSPSYLIMMSLDAVNGRLGADLPEQTGETAEKAASSKMRLRELGWTVPECDPLRLVIAGDGLGLADRLRAYGIECEHADEDHLILMLTPGNTDEDLAQLVCALSAMKPTTPVVRPLPEHRPEKAMTIREAFLSPRETVATHEALGRICAVPTVACPPAIPIAVTGEVIDEDTVSLLERYGVTTVDVVK
ncbi:MAG: amino acid decarboxylase [Clostridia bacterium]|nr:amino acid decarboxylase [Clostridia bacterium]